MFRSNKILIITFTSVLSFVFQSQLAFGDSGARSEIEFYRQLDKKVQEVKKDLEWSGLNKNIKLEKVIGKISSLNLKENICTVKFQLKTQIGGLVMPAGSVMNIPINKLVQIPGEINTETDVLVYFVTSQDAFGHTNFNAVGIRDYFVAKSLDDVINIDPEFPLIW